MNEEKREILKKLEVGTTFSGVDVICRQYKEIERLHSIIKEVREWAKKCSCQFTNDDGELVVSEISFNIQARPCDLFKILDKENNNE